MEAAVRRRAAAHAAAAVEASPPAKPPVKSSSPESGELPGSASAGAARQPLHQPAKRSEHSSPALRAQQAAPAAADLDIDAEAASDSSSEGGSSASGSDSKEEFGGGRTEPAVPAPAPAGVIVVERAEQRNAEVQRLLRAPRCGQAGCMHWLDSVQHVVELPVLHTTGIAASASCCLPTCPLPLADCTPLRWCWLLPQPAARL